MAYPEGVVSAVKQDVASLQDQYTALQSNPKIVVVDTFQIPNDPQHCQIIIVTQP